MITTLIKKERQKSDLDKASFYFRHKAFGKKYLITSNLDTIRYKNSINRL